MLAAADDDDDHDDAYIGTQTKIITIFSFSSSYIWQIQFIEKIKFDSISNLTKNKIKKNKNFPD